MIVIFGKHLRIIILLSSITLMTANKDHPPPKSVNVALETSFLLDPKDLHQNKLFVRNIQRFLDKLLKKPRSRFRAHGKRRDTKQELEERTDSVETLENKTETRTSIKKIFDFVKNVGQNFVNLTGNKIAEAVSNMHVEVITEPSKYKGSTAIPEEVFNSHTSLYLHKQVVHNKDNAEHLCDHCGKAFQNQAKLRCHQLAIHSAHSYACLTCGARFSWLSCLKRHNNKLHQLKLPENAK